MTIPQLYQLLAGLRSPAIISPFAIPLIVLLMGFVHNLYGGRKSPWRQLYGLIIVLTTGAVVGYFVVYAGSLFLPGGEPLPLDTTVAVILPVVWLLTLLTVKRAVDYRHLSGFANLLLLILEWALVWIAGLYAVWNVPARLPVTDALLLTLIGLVLFLILNAIVCAVANRGER